MRVRWGRVSAALVGCGLTGFGMLVGALWATAPEPTAVTRVTPASRGCATGEVLEAALSMRAVVGPSGELAAAAFREAARCRELAPVARTFEAHQLARDALEDADRRLEAGDADAALAIALDVWTVAVEQGHGGTLIDALVAGGDARWAGDRAQRALREASPSARDQAIPRLLAIGDVALDLSELLAREEAYGWAQPWDRGFPGLAYPAMFLLWSWDLRVRAPEIAAATDLAQLDVAQGADGGPMPRLLASAGLESVASRAHARALALAASAASAVADTGRCPDEIERLDDPWTGRPFSWDPDACALVTRTADRAHRIVAVEGGAASGRR